MKVKLIFDDWRLKGKSIYRDKWELTTGDFHSGTTFEGTITLDHEQHEELDKALNNGYNPVFWVMKT